MMTTTSIQVLGQLTSNAVAKYGGLIRSNRLKRSLSDSVHSANLTSAQVDAINRRLDGTFPASLRLTKRRVTRCGTTLKLCLALCVGNAAAGTYRYTDTPENEEAPKIQVCQDFMENLRRLGNQPMVCDRKFHSKSTQFSWPKWQSINAAANRDLVEQIWQYQYSWAYDDGSLRFKANPLGAKDTQRYHAMLKESFKERARRGDLKLAITKVLIEGILTNVLRINESQNMSPCKPERWSSGPPPSRQYYIVDDRVLKVNFSATETSALNGYSSNMRDMRPDLFLYRGQPFVSAWGENGVGRGRIEVFGDQNNYCFIDYTATSEGKRP
jgi:hypothetical protein